MAKINQQNQQQIKEFKYSVPKKYASLAHDQCTMSEDVYIKMIWGLSRKELFTFIRCAAGSITELNKYGIYHNNITFKDFIKLGEEFKFVGLERALYIPRDQLENTKIHLPNLPQQRIGKSQKQLEKSIRDILEYFLRFDYIRGKEESEWFDNDSNDSQGSILDHSFQERPQISDIPNYIFGEDNEQLVADFIKIKQNPKFERRENKIDKCIKILQDNYENLHLHQLQRLIQKLLRDQAWGHNMQKFNQQEIEYILRAVKQLRLKNSTLFSFIELLRHMQQYKQYQQSKQVAASRQQQQQKLKQQQPQQTKEMPVQKVFSQNQTISILQIEQFSEFIKKTPLSSLRQIQQFRQMVIQPIIKQTSNLAHLPAIHRLIMTLQSRTKSNQKIQQYFPIIHQLIKSLRQRSNLNKEKSLPILERDNQEDKYFKLFLQDQKFKRINPNSFSGSNILISQQIWKSKHFIGNQQPFFEHQIQQNKEKEYPEKKSNRMYFQQNIDADEMMKIDCLGCTTFMYEGFNIKVNGITKTDAICFPSILKISQDQHPIKRSINALINSGGGVILFACTREYLNIIAQGQIIEESDRQRITQQISEYLKCFYPMLNFYSNAQLRFVPIVKSPYDSRVKITNEKQQKRQRQYIQGRYVTVLRLCSSQMCQVVFYFCNNEMLLYKRDKGQTIQIKGQLTTKYIKCKFNKNYITEEEKEIFKVPSHCFDDHICLKPLQVTPMQNKQKQEINKKKDLSTAVKAYTQEVKYNYASVVFLFQNSYQNVKRHLIDNNIRNFEFTEEQNIFKQRVILLLHDTSPKKMKEIIQRYPVKKGKKTILMLNITNSLKLSIYMNKGEFKWALLQLKKKKSAEFLKLYEYKQEQYLETGSKVSLYYLFCLLRAKNFNNIKLVNVDISKLPPVVAKLLFNLQIISL